MAASTTSKYRYLDTSTAYDLWSRVYDTDNNFLQALDTLRVQTLLPDLLAKASMGIGKDTPLKMVDLGCGTGRGIVMLDDVVLGLNLTSHIIGLDTSPGMLAVARQRLEQAQSKKLGNKIDLALFDMPGKKVADQELTSIIPTSAQDADFVLSTLVLEHVQLEVFFAAVAKMLKVHGILLLTNMHGDMGKTTQAGFFDEATGQVVRPKSYIYSVEEIVKEAAKQGFHLVGFPIEEPVEASSWKELGPRAEKWIGTKVWAGFVFVRKGDYGGNSNRTLNGISTPGPRT